MNRKLRINRKKGLVTVCLYIFLLAFICACLVIWYFANLLGDNLLDSACLEVNRITSIKFPGLASTNGDEAQKALFTESRKLIIDIVYGGGA
jgi:hypothetical protein